MEFATRWSDHRQSWTLQAGLAGCDMVVGAGAMLVLGAVSEGLCRVDRLSGGGDCDTVVCCGDVSVSGGDGDTAVCCVDVSVSGEGDTAACCVWTWVSGAGDKGVQVVVTQRRLVLTGRCVLNIR